MEYQYLIFILLSFIVAAILSINTDNRVFTFIFVFFIFAQPVLTTKYSIILPWMYFDLQPNRIMLFIMLFYLLIDFGRRKKEGQKTTKQKRPSFEILLYLYFIAVIVSLAFNYSRIDPKTYLVTPAEILLFIVVYNVTKRHATELTLNAINNAAIILGVTASIIAVYQLFVDSSFLKICYDRMAFGSFVRSSAVFKSEYELGFLLIFSWIVVLAKYKGKPIVYGITPLLIAGLITTFHRLDLIIFVICYLTYYLIFNRIRQVFIFFMMLFFILCITVMSYFVAPNKFLQATKKGEVKSFVEDRLLSDTLSGRLYQYTVAVKAIAKYPLGLGGYDNDEYYKLMFRKNMGFREIHNGYLATGVKYGIFSMCFFLMMIILMIRYFWRKIEKNNLITICPFFIVLIWFLSNLTNSVATFKSYFVVLVGIITGTFIGIYQKKSDSIEES